MGWFSNNDKSKKTEKKAKAAPPKKRSCPYCSMGYRTEVVGGGLTQVRCGTCNGTGYLA